MGMIILKNRLDQGKYVHIIPQLQINMDQELSMMQLMKFKKIMHHKNYSALDGCILRP